MPARKPADDDTPPPITLTPRDAAICRDAHEHRLVDAQTIAWVHFPPAGGAAHADRPRPSSSVQRRLGQLVGHDFLQRVVRPVLPGTGQAPHAYALGREGATLLTRVYGLDPATLAVPTRATGIVHIDHTLGCVRVWAALAAACARTADVRLADWRGGTALRAASSGARVRIRRDGGAARTVPVIPDGTGVLRHLRADRPAAAARLFDELDRGTETNARVGDKFAAYAAYLRSAEYAATYGEAFALLLWVTESRPRLEHTLRTIAAVARDEPGLRGRVLGAVLDDLTPGTALGPIWTVADTGERRPLIRREQ
jgi:hypothetical protein